MRLKPLVGLALGFLTSMIMGIAAIYLPSLLGKTGRLRLEAAKLRLLDRRLELRVDDVVVLAAAHDVARAARGLQMLGATVHDPLGLEGEAGSSAGLGLLELSTTLAAVAGSGRRAGPLRPAPAARSRGAARRRPATRRR